MQHDLPHGASIDTETQVLKLPVGEKLVLKFSLDDFHGFCNIIDDLKTVMDFYTSITEYQCLKCGAIEIETDYVPPDEADEH
ncbi:hypothetical protein OAA09_00485 [bacterium]|nr:hypothetical protein [bacterium]